MTTAINNYGTGQKLAAASGSGTEADPLVPSVALASGLPAGSAAIGSTTDGGPGWTSSRGVSRVPVASADLTTRTAVTDAPTSSQKLVITDIIVSVGSTAMSILFEEETSNEDVLGPFYFPANTPPTQITVRGKLKLNVADKRLMATASVAGNLSITVLYYSEA